MRGGRFTRFVSCAEPDLFSFKFEPYLVGVNARFVCLSKKLEVFFFWLEIANRAMLCFDYRQEMNVCADVIFQCLAKEILDVDLKADVGNLICYLGFI